MESFRFAPFDQNPEVQWDNVILPGMIDPGRWFNHLRDAVQDGWFSTGHESDLQDWIGKWRNFATSSNKSIHIDWENVSALAKLAGLASRVKGGAREAFRGLRHGEITLAGNFSEDWVKVGIRSFLESPEEVRKIDVYVALADLSDPALTKGCVATLTLECFPIGDGSVSQDPRNTQTRAFPSCADAIAYTFRLACSADENRSTTWDDASKKATVDGRWSLRGLAREMTVDVDGASLGAAAYRGWYDCVGGRFPDSEVIVLAAIEGREIVPVGYIPEKITAVVKSAPQIDTIALHEHDLEEALDALNSLATTAGITAHVTNGYGGIFTPSGGLLPCIRLKRGTRP